MKRDLNQLADRHFDVLVVGGGIYGAAVAREAAVSGLETALIERNDFSHATSANSLKILHGGLRYLQDLDFRRMRASVESQKAFMRMAPELTAPLGCIIPTYGYGLRGKLPMRVALHLNDLISMDRKYIFEDGYKRGRGRIVSEEEYDRMFGLKMDRNINGAALWYDALVQDTERLTITCVNDAFEYGACIANYVSFKNLKVKKDRVAGALAADSLTGEEFEIRTRNVVNTTGPWLDKTLELSGGWNGEESFFASGLNIIVKKGLCKQYAIGLEGPGSGYDKEDALGGKNRFFFFIPWRGHTMIGTAYKAYDEDPDRFRVEREDIEDFIREVNLICPPAELTFEDVTYFHAGLLPAETKKVGNPGDVQPAKHCKVIRHEREGGPKGLVSVQSVKYTTAPHVAKRVLKTIEAPKGRSSKRRIDCEPSRKGGYGGAHTEGRVERSSDTVGPDLQGYLRSKYGRYADRIQNHIVEDEDLASWVSREPPLLSGEIRHAIQDEMAIRLSDVVFRRTGFGNAGCPSRARLEAVAHIMARELGWNDKERSDELESVVRSYHPLRLVEESDEKSRG